ncbi:uncharacterized protein B0T15DRAFT_506647 [Chaetomium strumarium]|uniref:Uncharacterized protein n=1 Tax=Chaetomium strumarium TaxID=1170767 RepID=A0AAJ0M5U8_9PEZI|nr:hypothetical protein B0T15DRAFT_506647 [Chaetomium strumarium]
MLVLFATIWLLAWVPFTVHAQDEPRTCVFRLMSADFVLSQLDGGQVLGLQPADPSSSNEGTGTLFRLRQGALYDGQLRGCWWAAPSTVLVCDILPPAQPDPLFEVDTTQRLVYNSSITSFWACPANAGSTRDGQQQQQYQQASAANFYLEVPEHLQDRDAIDHARSSGPCKRVAIEVAFIDTWFCNHNFPVVESASVRRTAIVARETSIVLFDTASASVREASGPVTAAETGFLETATARKIEIVPVSSESGTATTTFATVTSTVGNHTSVVPYSETETVL